MDSGTVKPVSIATTSGPQKSGLSREVVSLQRSKSIVQALLGHDQVVFIERGGPWIQVARKGVTVTVTQNHYYSGTYMYCTTIIIATLFIPIAP